MPTPTIYKVISLPRLFDGFPMVSNLIDKDTRRWKADLVRAFFLPFEANMLGSKSLEQLANHEHKLV